MGSEMCIRDSVEAPHLGMSLYHHSVAKTWGRRAITVPIFLLIAAILVFTSPLWGVLTFFYELTLGRGNRFSRLRTIIMITTFFVLEGVGIFVAVCLWVLFIGRTKSSGFTQAHLKLQWWWTTTNFAAIQRIFNLGLSIENACLLYTSPSPRDLSTSRMPSSA